MEAKGKNLIIEIFSRDTQVSREKICWEIPDKLTEGTDFLIIVPITTPRSINLVYSEKYFFRRINSGNHLTFLNLCVNRSINTPLMVSQSFLSVPSSLPAIQKATVHFFPPALQMAALLFPIPVSQ